MMNDKQKEILAEAEDIIAEAIRKYKNGEKIDPEQISLIYEGIRILHHIQNLRGLSKTAFPIQTNQMEPKA